MAADPEIPSTTDCCDESVAERTMWSDLLVFAELASGADTARRGESSRFGARCEACQQRRALSIRSATLSPFQDRGREVLQLQAEQGCVWPRNMRGDAVGQSPLIKPHLF